MGKIISITNQKGGVGKTTTTLNIGIGFKSLGKKVLLVDLDPQANLTSAAGLKNRDFEITVYDILKGKAGFQQAMIFHNGVYIVPASISMSGADIELSSVPGRELLLKEGLNKISTGFDYILIDCSPSLGLLTLNALTAAHEIFIPIQTEYLPLEGVKFLLDTVELVKNRLNKDLKIGGVIVTMYDGRQKLNKEIMEIICHHFGDKVFKTLIRKNISIAEAPGFGQDIYAYKPDSSGAKDYADLSREIIRREEF